MWQTVVRGVDDKLDNDVVSFGIMIGQTEQDKTQPNKN